MDDTSMFDKRISYHDVFYNIEGKECLDGEQSFAKEILKQSDQIDTISYYVLFKDSAMVDPWGDNCSLRNVRDYQFKRVTSDCFKFYIKYLKTRIIRHLTTAKRSQHG